METRVPNLANRDTLVNPASDDWRGEGQALARCLAVRLHPPCRSGSPDPDLFVIRRSQTTEVGPMPAGIRLPSEAE